MILCEDAAVRWVRDQPSITAETIERLECFVQMLKVENELQNLVSKSSLHQVWQRHIVDSLQLLAMASGPTISKWLDLGTGAGFPGLVIAACDPDVKMTLVESRSRRVEWLRRAAGALGLKNVHVEGQRLELVLAERFDIISARAFAPMTTLIPEAARFSTKETVWILPKGKTAANDLATLNDWDHTFHVEQSITDPQAGIVTGRLNGRKGPHP